MLGIFYCLLRLQRIACAHECRVVGEAQDAVLGEAVIPSCNRCGSLTRAAVDSGGTRAGAGA